MFNDYILLYKTEAYSPKYILKDYVNRYSKENLYNPNIYRIYSTKYIPYSYLDIRYV